MVGQGILNVLLIVFIKDVMHRDAQVYGWMITAQGVGSLLGAILVGSVSKFVRPVYLIVPGLVIAGACILVVINYPVLVLALSLIAFVGIFVVGTFVSMQTLLQQSVADSYRGRLFGTFNTTISVFMLVGMLLASGLGAQLGVVPLLDVAGIFTFLAGLAALAMLRDTGCNKTHATGENTASASLPVGEG
jgi:MFS family permease